MSDDVDNSDIEQLRKRELRRNRLLGTGILLVIVGGLIFAVLSWVGGLVGSPPKLPDNEKKAASQSDDPECRKLIAKVQSLRDEFRDARPKLENGLLGSDQKVVRRLNYQLSSLKGQVSDLEELALRSSFRSEESKKQVFDWIEYVSDELLILERLGEQRLEALEQGDDSKKSGRTGGDPGDSKPVERRDSAVVAIHSAFENFRTWHTAGVHPCGQASDQETPWQPEDTDAPAAETSSKANGETRSTDE